MRRQNHGDRETVQVHHFNSLPTGNDWYPTHSRSKTINNAGVKHVSHALQTDMHLIINPHVLVLYETQVMFYKCTKKRQVFFFNDLSELLKVRNLKCLLNKYLYWAVKMSRKGLFKVGIITRTKVKPPVHSFRFDFFLKEHWQNNDVFKCIYKIQN